MLRSVRERGLRQANRRVPIDDWACWLGREDVFIVDTETTGLDASTEVIEVAAIDTRGSLCFESLALPIEDIPEAASRIHGLTRAELERRGAPAWPQIHGELVELLRKATVVLGWNTGFDNTLLSQTARRHALVWPSLAWHDLLDDDRRMHPGGRHSLEAVARRERVSSALPTHRAARDCQTVLGIMRAAVNRRAVRRGPLTP